ncbi:hypothetical protein MMC30_004440 [Trapelia coarctata]|nr:hypothetical protein [Trapelia coarctata]
MPKRSRTDSISSASSASTASGSCSTDAALHPSKYIEMAANGPSIDVMQCILPPHDPLSFPSYEAYDVHYAQDHTNRCLECHKNFPSEHFLNLHIAENHDPLNEALRAKGEKTYRCFLSDCDRVCSAPHKRRMHLIDKHQFPKNYDFLVVNTGMDKRSSMLRGHRRHSSIASYAAQRRSSIHQASDAPHGESSSASQAVGTDGNQPSSHHSPKVSREDPSSPRRQVVKRQDDVDSLADSLSALKFVPPSVRFGRGGRKAGFARS